MYFILMDDIEALNRHYHHGDLLSLEEYQSLVCEVEEAVAHGFKSQYAALEWLRSQNM